MSTTSEETGKRTRGRGIILKNLRHERESRGLGLRELEELTRRVGDGGPVYRSTINELELLERGAQGRTVRKLAAALGVSPADLVGDPEPARS